MLNCIFNKSFEYLSRNTYLRGLCNTFVMLLPIPVISALCGLLSNFFHVLELDLLSGFMGLLSETARSLYPVLLLIYYSLFLSKKEDVSRVIVITSSLIIVLIICDGCYTVEDPEFIKTHIPFFMTVLIPILVSKFIRYTHNQKWIMRSELPSVIDQSINLVGITLLSIIVIALPAFYLSNSVMAEVIDWSTGYDVDSLLDAVIIETIRNLLWTIGMNGHAVLPGTYLDLELGTISSHMLNENLLKGSSEHIFSNTFLSTYASIGGAGNTLSLVICMLLSNNKEFRRLGMVSLIFSFFNINELVIYGLPVMFNPILIIPFIITPIFSLVSAYWATVLGLVEPVTMSINWMTPALYSGYLSTAGDMNAIALQAMIIVVGVFIYLPFFRKMDVIEAGNCTFLKSISDDYFNYEKIGSAQHIGGILPEMTLNIQAQNRINELEKSGEFVLFYQPQYNLLTNKIVSIEALIRHIDFNGKVTPPIFIEDFNKVGLASNLDFWVLRRALNQTAVIINDFGITVSVNISPVTFVLSDFFDVVKAEIEKLNIAFSSVILEITEGVLIKDELNTAKTIEKFRSIGVQVALDDFGSGYSSLGYLSKYNFDIVKIDRTLTMNTDNNVGEELFSLTCKIVRALGAKIVVEGVEKQSEVELMKKEKINTAQGFFFAKPQPIEKITFTKNI